MNEPPLTTSQRETLGLFADADAPLTTPEVADRLEVGRRSAYERLERLVDHGLLETKEVGASARIWWLSEDASGADSHQEDSGRAERGGSRDADRERERYAGLVDALDEPVYELDAEGRITFVNESFVEYASYTEEELLGSHVSIGMDEEAIDRAEALMVDLATSDADDVATLEYDVVSKEGDRIPVENRFTLLTDEDGRVRGSAGALRDLTDRVERERELERQRERLAVLNNLHGVVRDVTHAVIDRSTREEIESAVCERLVADDTYTRAWIGEVDAAAESVDVRARADRNGASDTAGVLVAPEGQPDADLVGEALRSGEVRTRTVRPADGDDAGTGEHQVAAETGGAGNDDGRTGTWAMIPITHDETTYGVLAVLAECPEAFDDEERAVIGQLGEITGHAIAAVDRKQALMSDAQVELTFRVGRVFELPDVDPPSPDAITIEHVTPVAEGAYLAHGKVREGAVESLRATVEATPGWDDLRLPGAESSGPFAVRLTEAPILSALASVGGVVDRAVVDGGDIRIRALVPPGTEVRRLIDVVAAEYPDAELLTQRQVVRRPERPDVAEGNLPAALTDSQRTALEVAVHAGYFEWPRASSGTEVSESLGVAPPTFYQHLRAAQRKVFEWLVDDQAED